MFECAGIWIFQLFSNINTLLLCFRNVYTGKCKYIILKAYFTTEYLPDQGDPFMGSAVDDDF